MKQYKKTVFYLFLLALIEVINAQELPPITTYMPKDYGAEIQNWSISQSKEKFIYVANNKGLLEFNGASWRLYPSPNETIFRSVKVFNNKIYTGFYMDFGFWTKNKYGNLKYTSISKKLKIPLLEDEQFWNIIELDGWILFQSLQRIYLYNLKTEHYKTILSETQIVKMVKVDETIYFQKKGIGVFKIENGKAVLVSDALVLKTNNIVTIYKQDKKLLFLTQDNGFFLLSGKELVQWEIPANKKIFNFSVYSSIQLKNKDFIIGTISDGLIHLSKEGKIKYHITQNNGLGNNTILSVFEDAGYNIWLGLDNGISTINISSAFKSYINNNGNLGTVYTSIINDEVRYLGTNQGLFYKKNNTNDDFTFIENTQGQVWSLVKIDGNLFCGHNSGTFIIKKNKAKKIVNVAGTWNIKKLKKNLYLQGNYNGLNIFEKINEKWVFKNKVEGFDISSRFFEVDDDFNVFVNHEYKGVFKLSMSQSFDKITRIEKIASVEKGIHSSLTKYQNKILYANKYGVYSYHKKENTFIRDSILSTLYTEDTYSSGKLIYTEFDNLLWSFSKKNIHYVSAGKLSNNPVINTIPISGSLRKGATSYENISHIKDQKYLLGISNGYLIVNLEDVVKVDEFDVYINTIKSNALNDTLKSINLSKKINFHSSQNNLEFSFSVPNFSKFSETEYQYLLEGNDLKWSNWSSKSTVFFKNLPSGKFTFKVKARIGNKYSNNIASFDFLIDKKWYFSNKMLTFYIVLIILFSFFMHVSYKKYYKKEQEKLLEKTQKDLELKELAIKQEIMQLKNEKLQNDIENKNKELATSTMRIIKKNEFLNTIKKELKNSNGIKINKVLKIIDKNLNNTDDWRMFQEAFNNADKDFLKKIKKEHPTLTPNDLRLCAYLRLNLSSKEIAPLLNISPRSVEVKRYRLRKKINLPHKSSLTSYILEI